METILTITYLYLLVLLLSLLVERAMEVIMACWDYLEMKLDLYKMWNRRAQRLMDDFDSKVKARLSEGKLASLTIRRRVKMYSNALDGFYPGKTIVFSSKKVRKVFVRAIVFVVTSSLGIMLCYQAGINFIQIIQEALAPQTISIFNALGQTLQLIISGLIIGLGAEPVHRIIKSLEHTRDWLEMRNRLGEEVVASSRARQV